MSGSTFASGACRKSMWRTSAYPPLDERVKKGETSASPLAGAPSFMGAPNRTIDEELVLRRQRNGKADVGAMRRAERHPQAPAVRFDD
jgi:hypothetical protein